MSVCKTATIPRDLSIFPNLLFLVEDILPELQGYLELSQIGFLGLILGVPEYMYRAPTRKNSWYDLSRQHHVDLV